jgi:NO-binding membrane sensor protein with MHYT domain
MVAVVGGIMMTANLFAYGWVNPVLGWVMSASGCLLAIVLAIKARARYGRGRARPLAYAIVALGGIGIFQSQFLALLGFNASGTVLRYHWPTLLISLGVAVVTVAAGLATVCFGRPSTARQVAAGMLIGAGTVAAHAVAVNAMRGVDYLYYAPIPLAASVAIGLGPGYAITRFIVSLRGLGAAILTACVAGAGICGMHYTAMSAVRTQAGPLIAVDGSQPVVGLTPTLLIGPAVLLGAAAAVMAWFFTVGTSTVHDLKAIFEDPGHSVEIEPWMIAEVTQRATVRYRPPVTSLPPTSSPTLFTTPNLPTGPNLPSGGNFPTGRRRPTTPGLPTAPGRPTAAGPAARPSRYPPGYYAVASAGTRDPHRQS